MIYSADVLVIGGGIAGASAAAGISDCCKVIVLEQESIAGYHTTGRSAAFFAETYGNEAVQKLTTASKSFFLNPKGSFTDVPLVYDRGGLFLARPDQLQSLQALYEAKHAVLPSVRHVGVDFIIDHVPLIKPDYAVAAVWDPGCRDIDVHALHQGFLRMIRAHGSEVKTCTRVVGLRRERGLWNILTESGDIYQSPKVINAAGAWADDIGQLAGARPIGLMPKRRTIAILPAPEELKGNDWPLVLDADDQFYFKPESGRILASPGDATPMPPQDIQPDLEDVAIAVNRIEAVVNTSFARVDRKWAGLRTFAPDENPVVGADPDLEGFYWFAGQGGYGMQTAPAMSALICGLVLEGEIPSELQAYDLEPEMISPARFKN